MTGPIGPAGGASTVPGPQGPMGFNGTNGVNGTNGAPGPRGPNQIPPNKIYFNVGNLATTLPSNSSLGAAQSVANCNPGDTAISGQVTMLPLVRNFYPGSGAPPESLSGSYINGFSSFSNPTNTAWIIEVLGNHIQFQSRVTCFDN